MDIEKQKRLESKGWRVGTVQEFLELTDDEALQVEKELQLWKQQKSVSKSVSVVR